MLQVVTCSFVFAGCGAYDSSYHGGPPQQHPAGPTPPYYPNDNTNNAIPGGMNEGSSHYGSGPPPMSYAHPHDDFIDSSSRSGQQQWSSSQMQQRFSQHGGTPYSMSQQIPPTSASVPPYGMYNRMDRSVARMSPQRPDKQGYFSPPKVHIFKV